MNLHDVIRHLVERGPFDSDTHRAEALAAVDADEAAARPGAPPVFIPEDFGD